MRPRAPDTSMKLHLEPHLANLKCVHVMKPLLFPWLDIRPCARPSQLYLQGNSQDHVDMEAGFPPKGNVCCAHATSLV